MPQVYQGEITGILQPVEETINAMAAGPLGVYLAAGHLHKTRGEVPAASPFLSFRRTK
jgi:hypothetical protein